MAYLPKLNPTVGGGLGGLPERRATGGGASANSVQRSIIGQAVKGSLAYRNTTTGETYSLDPIEGLLQENTVTLSGKIGVSGIDVKMFSDGKYVIAYTDGSNNTCFEVYNFDGTIAVSQVTVEAATTGGRRLVMCIDPSTDNINIFYHQGTSSGILRHAVYSKTGTTVVAAYTLISALNVNDYPDILAVDFWSDGWFVVGSTRGASTDNYITVFNSSRTLQAQSTVTFDVVGGRLAVCALDSTTRTFAYQYSSAGGLTSTTGRNFLQLARFDGVNISAQYNSFLGNIGGTGYGKAQICFNEIDKEVVAFFCSENNYLTMTPTQLFYKNNNSQFAPTKMKMLEYCLASNMTATSLGGDRFMVTYGGGQSSNEPLYAGIINSVGDWIAPPTIVRARLTGDSTYGYVRAASCKALGLAIVAIPYGSVLYLRTFRYRNTTTETYRLSDQYPVKIADFNPFCNVSYPNPFNINAQQATNKFVVAWTQNSNDITWAIYSSGGTIQSGPFVNTAISGGNNLPIFIKALLLPNGNVVLIAQVNTQIKFGIYNSSGVLQGSITTITSTGTAPVSEVATNGNFVICYRNSSTGYAHYICYDQSGASQGTATISSVAISPDTQKIIYSAINDKFMYVAIDSATNYFNFSIRLNTGAQSVGFQAIAANAMSEIALCCNPDGTWSFIMLTSSDVMYFRKLTAAGLNSVSMTNTNMNFTSATGQSLQLIPYTNSEIILIHTLEGSQTTNLIKLSNTNGAVSSTTKSFGISSAWYERYFQLYDASPNKYRNDQNAGAVSVSVSLNGDQYIATAWGDIYRLSSSVTTGDYVIDGIVNSDAINSTVEVITNGAVTRSNNLPRTQAFIANGANSKKIIASKKSIFVSA